MARRVTNRVTDDDGGMLTSMALIPPRRAVFSERDGLIRYDGLSDQTRSMPSDLLDRFLALLNQPPQAYAEFAGRFGPLLLCAEHQLPITHAPMYASQLKGSRPYQCRLLNGDGKQYDPQRVAGAEPWKTWRAIAYQFQAILDAGTHLAAGGSAVKFWPAIFEGGIRTADALPSSPSAPKEQRRAIARLLRLFAQIGALYVGIVWDDDRPTPRMEFRGGLFGALTLQLMQRLGEAGPMDFCKECREPKRLVRSGPWKGYCARCRRKLYMRNQRGGSSR